MVARKYEFKIITKLKQKTDYILILRVFEVAES